MYPEILTAKLSPELVREIVKRRGAHCCNSKPAFQQALETKAKLIEVDVFGNKVQAGHWPEQEAQSLLIQLLALAELEAVDPPLLKLDIKSSLEYTYHQVLAAVVNLLTDYWKQHPTIISIDDPSNPFAAERHLAQVASQYPDLALSITLARYENCGYNAQAIANHLRLLQGEYGLSIDIISPEIHQPRLETSFETAQEHHIPLVSIWMRTNWNEGMSELALPVTAADFERVLKLEEQYPDVKTIFELDPHHFNINSLL